MTTGHQNVKKKKKLSCIIQLRTLRQKIVKLPFQIKDLFYPPRNKCFKNQGDLKVDEPLLHQPLSVAGVLSCHTPEYSCLGAAQISSHSHGQWAPTLPTVSSAASAHDYFSLHFQSGLNGFFVMRYEVKNLAEKNFAQKFHLHTSGKVWPKVRVRSPGVLRRALWNHICQILRWSRAFFYHAQQVRCLLMPKERSLAGGITLSLKFGQC